MNSTIIERFMSNKEAIRACFDKKPAGYLDVVKAVVSNVTTDSYGDCDLDPERIHVIDDGDYQGTLLYVIAEKGYQPSDYWCVKISYGSCSGCDTLAAIDDMTLGDDVTEEQKDQYMTLALHVAQQLKKMADEEYIND